MNDSEETNSSTIKALIVFREDGNTDNLFVPILCDAIRMTGINVRCSTQEFWESDTAYDIIHFQWPEEVVGWTCDNPDIICRLEERIRFFRSRGHISFIRATMYARTMPTTSSAGRMTSSSRKAMSWCIWAFQPRRICRQASRQPECRDSAPYLPIYLSGEYQRRACTPVSQDSAGSVHRHRFRQIPQP